jgi:hypothetical protein
MADGYCEGHHERGEAGRLAVAELPSRDLSPDGPVVFVSFTRCTVCGGFTAKAKAS